MATCSICNTDFEPHFSYQTERRPVSDPDGNSELRLRWFCSQRCLETSFKDRTDGSVSCYACGERFHVELASQVLFSNGRRHYVCTTNCRTTLLDAIKSIRRGQLLDPGFSANDDAGVELPAPPETVTEAFAAQEPAADAAKPPMPAVLEPSLASSPQRRSATPARIVSVFNHKGGTGKTTTAIHLAAGLAQRGQRVLLVDTDGQGNVAASLRLPVQRSLYHVLVMGMPLKQAVTTARPGLDVLASNETTAAAELYLAGRHGRDRILADRLAGARDLYDYVILDCSPSLSLMNQNALVMSDQLLCPVSCDYLSLIGVRQVLGTLKQVNRLLRHPVQLWAVLPTQFDARARICHEALETLREYFQERCLEPVRVNIKVKEAPSQGKTLFEYAPGSNAAADYLRVVDRLLSDGNANDTENFNLAIGGAG